jgi:transposase
VARGAGGDRRRRDWDLGAAGINRETLRRWVIEQEVETGDRPGLIRAERSRIVELERENKELRRANEILKTAAAFFGAELDRQRKK